MVVCVLVDYHMLHAPLLSLLANATSSHGSLGHFPGLLSYARVRNYNDWGNGVECHMYFKLFRPFLIGTLLQNWRSHQLQRLWLRGTVRETTGRRTNYGYVVAVYNYIAEIIIVYYYILHLFLHLEIPPEEDVEICKVEDGVKKCRSLSEGRKGLLSLHWLNASCIPTKPAIKNKSMIASIKSTSNLHNNITENVSLCP